LFFCLLVSISIASTATAKKNSLEDFFRPAKISKVALSPDGMFVAGLAPIGKGDEIGLVMLDLETLEPKTIKYPSGYDIFDFNWVNNENIVFRLGKWNTYVAGVYKVNRNKIRSIKTMLDNNIIVDIIDPLSKNEHHLFIIESTHTPANP
jgi:hypothetical protein